MSSPAPSGALALSDTSQLFSSSGAAIAAAITGAAVVVAFAGFLSCFLYRASQRHQQALPGMCQLFLKCSVAIDVKATSQQDTAARVQSMSTFMWKLTQRWRKYSTLTNGQS
ncbi:hypothetical protein WJX73_008062 [Symbiochloris irregularis]|uniref:Uncharacterized protein n=1 Tax=Symbiochloris irregularis TaxID=706552 RepID=A0AAW1PEI1_9CHLO